eukprot:NODE_8873_length_497_cov_7.850446_g7803_i0.p3 GENE.NODE_8873_length_497_cov_7.850446_g7803_i0~~NODE_8873_length_497_cov_7.850446_g7803_i0.p3  ORF type:complete len:80 (+),score=0.55 NODE_8873_length_497_cov_7.850446_g7803_i0:245-484(+)
MDPCDELAVAGLNQNHPGNLVLQADQNQEGPPAGPQTRKFALPEGEARRDSFPGDHAHDRRHEASSRVELPEPEEEVGV